MGLDLNRSTGNRLNHLGLKSNRLMFKLLWTLTTLSIEFTNTAIWKTDKLDRLHGGYLRSAPSCTLDNWGLRDADLVTLVDVGVLLDSVVVEMMPVIKRPYIGFPYHGLQAFLFLCLN